MGNEMVEVTISAQMAAHLAAHLAFERDDLQMSAAARARIVALAGDDSARSCVASVLLAGDEVGIACVDEIAFAFARLAEIGEGQEIALSVAAAEVFTLLAAIAADGDGGPGWVFGERA